MGVDYLGIHLGTLEYLAVLLFGLIIFVIIMILTERGRQRRHNMKHHKARERAQKKDGASH
jgi:uncharacterized membrane protein